MHHPPNVSMSSSLSQQADKRLSERTDAGPKPTRAEHSLQIVATCGLHTLLTQDSDFVVSFKPHRLHGIWSVLLASSAVWKTLYKAFSWVSKQAVPRLF